jgi:ribonuclease VapC
MIIEARKGENGGRELDLFLHRAKIDIVPVDSEQAELARIAWRQYGKGRHPAQLNFGDCFAYALSKISGEPILFKGNDFSLTDVRVVQAS